MPRDTIIGHRRAQSSRVIIKSTAGGRRARAHRPRFSAVPGKPDSRPIRRNVNEADIIKVEPRAGVLARTRQNALRERADELAS